MRGYFLVYGVRESRMRRMGEFFRRAWPAAVRDLWRESLVIALLLFLGIGLSWALVAQDPGWYAAFVPEGLSGGREPGADPAFLRSTLFGGDDSEQRSGLHIFATYLFTHNSQVAIGAYALGFAFGLPTMVLVFLQGLSTGPMLWLFQQAGLLTDFLGWLAIHGTTELFAIILAGAAGLRIGWSFAFPGPHSRLVSAASAGRASGAVVLGVVIMLLIAGLLEGFGRQLILSTPVRFAVGGAMLLFWLSYFYVPRRGRTTQ